jgi:hypothetical protein
MASILCQPPGMWKDLKMQLSCTDDTAHTVSPAVEIPVHKIIPGKIILVGKYHTE